MAALPPPALLPAPTPRFVAPYAMQARYGWLLQKLLHVLFRHLHYVPAEAGEKLRQLQASGVVVYVTRGHFCLVGTFVLTI